ncbi:LptA/OstA family protein [Agrobacterium larrymoorei]|uniref:LptA/OstA family protein n=1 Tax=Agrobacterium larrymoorei TaxID=160699 RepID=A0AAF0H7T7_9HYPH|nr:LptA/OstA family protein [Agrobacterium larrymoorei]WHA41063.1 LptA/OstA family protein [Agrobacterium larrymoorei]
MMQISRPAHFSTATGFAAAILLASLTSPAFAQNTTSKMDGMKLSSDQPIAIESDQLEVRDQERKAYFTGNVKVVQGTTTLRAGKMTVLYKSSGDGQQTASVASGNADIDKIFVDNSVYLTSGTQKATADHGEFDMASQTFTLSGKQVVLSQDTNVFTGCKLTVLMNTGEAKLESCGGPVRIMLDPKSQKKQ